MTQPLFEDSGLQRRYDTFGYVVVHALDDALVSELREYFRSSRFEDLYGAGHIVSLYSTDIETRRRAQELLISRAFPFLKRFVPHRCPYMSTFLVKEPNARLIPPHQDWSHCDETEHDSLMCWIPLCDVDENNGGLAFVKGSHKYFDHLRAFPYRTAPTPDYRHWQKLVPYMSTVPMKAGDAVLFNNRTLHGSLPNGTAEQRLAFSFSLHPVDHPLTFHYIKPNGRADTLLRYEVTPDFYLEYSNPRVTELYRKGMTIPGGVPEEMRYHLEQIEWEALEEKLIASDNHPDPALVARAEELLAGQRPG